MGQAEGHPASPRWFVLDVGEVLIDETRVWATWAQVLGIPAFTLMACIGAVVNSGGDHTDAFRLLGIDGWEQRAPQVEEQFGGLQIHDLYDDALPAIATLRAAGYRVAVIGNQPAARHQELLDLGVEVEVMAMSDALGVHKPDPEFFAQVLRLTNATANAIAYVGDRVDNDIVPSLAAGMRAVWLRRGPWGALHRLPSGVTAIEVRSLTELATNPDRVWPDGVWPDRVWNS